MMDKGLPVPPELLVSQRDGFATQNKLSSALRTALALLRLGVDLIIFFWARGGDNWGIGAIPLAIGLAQLLEWKIERPKVDTVDSDLKD